ncbi:potassium channel family protein [Actinoplanes sp. Pm04-4]|uniref:Potassium channel family protein n=1 Tax=Paractinoplanes pyxinae TaxID=2997416 RepID=A0ABT4B3H7_9ACTN|nr:potassium channel family protein [Actinoplanes pyxinae]MCY1141049.1 potassium channel family protein [Actinoplanes pyxinae]
MTDGNAPSRPGYAPVIGLIIFTYVLATSVTERVGVALVLVVQVGTVWYVLRLASIRPHLRNAATAVFVLAVVSAVWALVFPTNWLVGLTFLAGCVLYAIAPLAIVADVARRAVDRELLLGALAAYLMLGMAFGFAYRCIALLQPGPFFGDAGDAALPDALFFSFVTLTTTGYGDLVPTGNPGRSLAVLEALTGQLFLVTAVAKVVEAWRPRRRRD